VETQVEDTGKPLNPQGVAAADAELSDHACRQPAARVAVVN